MLIADTELSRPPQSALGDPRRLSLTRLIVGFGARFPAATLVALVFLANPSLCQAKADILRFDQVGTSYGPVELFVSKDGMHATGKNTDFEVVCKAPTWETMTFNRKDKLYSTVSFKHWLASGPSPMAIELKPLLPEQLVGHETLCGHACSHYKFWRVNGSGRGRHMEFEAWLLDDFKVDPHVALAIDALYSLCTANQVPVATNRYSGEKNHIFSSLATKSITAAAAVSAGIEYPSVKGYKKAGGPEQVIVNSGGKQELFKIMDDMGLGDAPGTPANKRNH